MTSPARGPSRRTLVVGVLVGVAVLALAVALLRGMIDPAGPASPPAVTPASTPPSPPTSEPAPRSARTVDVMTRNLYLGADLEPVLRALASGEITAVVDAATQTWASVRATRPRERMAAIAEEIVTADPAVVGLQEVTTWTTYSYDPAAGLTSGPVVSYDFLELLLEELAARGVTYEAVAGATSRNFTSPPIPVLAGSPIPTQAIQLADRDVVLRRGDVATTHARAGAFETAVGFPFAGMTLSVARGWGSVDVRTGSASFRFVNAHLESFGVPGVDAEQVRVAQVGELLAAQEEVAAEAGALPTVLVGDYNSEAPSAPAYARLVEAVGSDAWTEAGGGAGSTCCFDAAVSDPDDPLTRRIDLVLVSPEVEVVRAVVVGAEPDDLTSSGRWPSDHAGVLARIVLPVR